MEVFVFLDLISVLNVHKQVQIGSHAFTFDYVFGSAGYPSSRIYAECVAPIVDALFHGYNGTVLAYGQVYIVFLWFNYSILLHIA